MIFCLISAVVSLAKMLDEDAEAICGTDREEVCLLDDVRLFRVPSRSHLDFSYACCGSDQHA